MLQCPSATINYGELLIIDKSMKKKDLISLAGLSTSTLAKMGKNQQVSMDVIIRICKALDCNIGIMDIT